MIIIRFFSSFGPSEGCSETYTRVSELNKDPLFNKVYCFTTGDDYTHVIIMNTAMPSLPAHIPKENVVGLAFEPLEFLNLTQRFVEYAKAHIGHYLVGDTRNGSLPKPFVEHFAYMWPLTRSVPVVALVKPRLMSLMISRKKMLKGHVYRHTLAQCILQSNLPIDIWGNGCILYNNNNNNNSTKMTTDPRLKGEFTGNEPYMDYKFHIAIENTQTPHYFSEKIMNPLLCEAQPIYLGCRNIDTYFPNMVLHLTGDVNQDMRLLHEVCRDPAKFTKAIDVAEVKRTLSFSNIVQKFFIKP